MKFLEKLDNMKKRVGLTAVFALAALSSQAQEAKDSTSIAKTDSTELKKFMDSYAQSIDSLSGADRDAALQKLEQMKTSTAFAQQVYDQQNVVVQKQAVSLPTKYSPDMGINAIQYNTLFNRSNSQYVGGRAALEEAYANVCKIDQETLDAMGVTKEQLLYKYSRLEYQLGKKSDNELYASEHQVALNGIKDMLDCGKKQNAETLARIKTTLETINKYGRYTGSGSDIGVTNCVPNGGLRSKDCDKLNFPAFSCDGKNIVSTPKLEEKKVEEPKKIVEEPKKIVEPAPVIEDVKPDVVVVTPVAKKTPVIEQTPTVQKNDTLIRRAYNDQMPGQGDRFSPIMTKDSLPSNHVFYEAKNPGGQETGYQPGEELKVSKIVANDKGNSTVFLKHVTKRQSEIKNGGFIMRAKVRD